ncbi:Ctr copper transporter [Xylona heveae TC161]|uniref:Copper transport protein n=1 Tax=Xylona heveae (strain CBS 132557 / TC161) TaxID=1328760 RepID=A0A165J8P3_XYLHT|nr:Ctr copper transporter [Xylona heveae TC161]KZF25900.1 Ctr copper transporter [Xylona heveae TC161]
MMDHGTHGDMPMDHAHRCSMNMLFTWNTKDLCIVFYSWHVHSTLTLLGSLVAIVALGAGYEYVREISRRYEQRCAAHAATLPRRNAAELDRKSKVIKALLYAIQVFYSFFIMLLFMTYNGWIMIAVAVGAFVGYLIWGGSSATKSVACH